MEHTAAAPGALNARVAVVAIVDPATDQRIELTPSAGIATAMAMRCPLFTRGPTLTRFPPAPCVTM
jgi:hypothetical protein